MTAFWQGAFGDDYTLRNTITPELVGARCLLWRDILAHIPSPGPTSFLEFGANIGSNLKALARITPAGLYAVEPNARARVQLCQSSVAEEVRSGTCAEPNVPAGFADLAFTSGVLIHIPPEDLPASLAGIHRSARRWIVAIEYFSKEPVEVPYRGHAGRLWKRDFGSLWLDTFPDLVPLGCGFAWQRMTGLDDLTFWIFAKR